MCGDAGTGGPLQYCLHALSPAVQLLPGQVVHWLACLSCTERCAQGLVLHSTRIARQQCGCNRAPAPCLPDSSNAKGDTRLRNEHQHCCIAQESYTPVARLIYLSPPPPHPTHHHHVMQVEMMLLDVFLEGLFEMDLRRVNSEEVREAMEEERCR